MVAHHLPIEYSYGKEVGVAGSIPVGGIDYLFGAHPAMWDTNKVEVAIGPDRLKSLDGGLPAFEAQRRL